MRRLILLAFIAVLFFLPFTAFNQHYGGRVRACTRGVRSCASARRRPSRPTACDGTDRTAEHGQTGALTGSLARRKIQQALIALADSSSSSIRRSGDSLETHARRSRAAPDARFGRQLREYDLRQLPNFIAAAETTALRIGATGYSRVGWNDHHDLSAFAGRRQVECPRDLP